MLEKRIAEKIRRIRTSRGLTLAQLGQRVGLSRGMLSRIENNQSSPPIATLAKIAHGLQVPISLFFQEEDQDYRRYAVTLKSQRRQVVRKGSRIGFTYYSLNKLKAPSQIEAFVLQHPAGKKPPQILFDHPGEEFLFVLKGRVEFIYGREVIKLGPGESVHFDPTVPHRVQSAGRGDSECLVIMAGRQPAGQERGEP